MMYDDLLIFFTNTYGHDCEFKDWDVDEDFVCLRFNSSYTNGYSIRAIFTLLLEHGIYATIIDVDSLVFKKDLVLPLMGLLRIKGMLK